ncbi:hypothetical protein KCP71_24490 [Salmonella enterica subsp. enterica]|nr:hypothetical protein KCP71_24490 [Salmonella enterica subsp. enterica]
MAACGAVCRPELADAFWLCTKPVRSFWWPSSHHPAGGEVITRLKPAHYARATAYRTGSRRA